MLNDLAQWPWEMCCSPDHKYSDPPLFMADTFQDFLQMARTVDNGELSVDPIYNLC